MIIKAKVKLYDTEENFLSDFQIKQALNENDCSNKINFN